MLTRRHACPTRREEGKGKEGNTPLPPTGESVGFSRFWDAYPRKTAKPAAARAFAKVNPDDALLGRILAAVSRQAASDQWRKDGGQFIPHPATWLNGQRWDDDIPGATSTASTAWEGAL